ncbi:hypothetical protein C7N43_18720 [Sphingobacteriales bacterium UPWRP_1]|nr:hypothetical protein B6N25_06565 [Sphingobacteriales bacterium TSM_CSS]PSJ75484.1 hypothetical protein C7N43_18720 [Sphingobacteriales bacterium UPWRP_1]
MSKNLWKSSFFKLPQHKQFNYIPRYYDPQTDKENQTAGEDTIKLERGAFFKQKNRSRLVGAFTDKEVSTFERFRQRQSGQLVRVLMMAGLLTLAMLILLDQVSLASAVPFLVLFSVVFLVKARTL